MKALLRIFYFFAVLIVLILLAGLFLPQKAHVESSIMIHANPDIIFDQVNDLRSWENWSPWTTEDTTMKITFGNKTEGTGATYSWKSLHSGNGSLVISKSDPYTFIQTELNFHSAGKAYSPWKFEQEGKFTKVTWAYDNPELSYLERYFVVLFRKNMLKLLHKGLVGLKSTSEKLRLSRVSEVSVVNIPERNVMAVRDSADKADFIAAVNKTTAKVKKYLDIRKIDTIGKPFTIIHDWQDTASIVYQCAFPIPARTWGWSIYQCLNEPAGKAETVTHYGLFMSKKAFKVLEAYAKKNGYTVAGSPWVEYLTGPSTEHDTSKWKMQVYLPIK